MSIIGRGERQRINFRWCGIQLEGLRIIDCKIQSRNQFRLPSTTTSICSRKNNRITCTVCPTDRPAQLSFVCISYRIIDWPLCPIVWEIQYRDIVIDSINFKSDRRFKNRFVCIELKFQGHSRTKDSDWIFSILCLIITIQLDDTYCTNDRLLIINQH